MIQGESNVYLVIAPGGGLAGVHLDQEGAARTQASLIGGVVACVPVIADFRELPVTAAPDRVHAGLRMPCTPCAGPCLIDDGEEFRRGLAGQVAANAETRARRACCGSTPGAPHRVPCWHRRPEE